MFRIAWRRSYQRTYCDDDVKESGELIGPSDAGTLNCVDCSEDKIRVGDVYFYCTDYSETEDWSSGTRSYSFTFPGLDSYTLR